MSTADGRWHAGEPVSVRGTRNRLGLPTVRVRGYRGRLFKRSPAGWINDDCGHEYHLKRGAARQCAEREARRRNRKPTFYRES